MKVLLLAVVALVLFSTPVFASKNSDAVKFWVPVTVGSTQLPAGDYKVTWEGSGSNVQVTLARDSKHKVQVPASAVQGDHAQKGIVLTTENGANVLHAINLSHLSLVFDGNQAQGSTGR